MVFAALLLLLPVPASGGAPAVNSPAKNAVSSIESGDVRSNADKTAVAAKSADDGKKPAAAEDTAKDSTLTARAADGPAASSKLAALPLMPSPKANGADAASAAGDPAVGAAFPVAPVKPAIVAIHETPAQRKVWYALALAGHTGATFDAWSTRRAIQAGAGTEANPLLRPFAHSNALYAATQVSPLVMDFVGKKMMTSQHKWLRKMWWLPQTAGTGLSFAAATHNVGLVH